MIKKLRGKLFGILMSSMSILLVIILITIYGFANYSNNQQIQQDLNLALSGVTYDQRTYGQVRTDLKALTVEIDPVSRTIITSNVNWVLDNEILQKMVNEALSHSEEFAQLTEHPVTFKRSITNSVLKIAFIDIASQQQQLTDLRQALLVMFLTAELIFLFVAAYLSDKASQPIEESFKKQQDFIANASHELKSPLTIIQANTDIILSQPGSNVYQQQKWLDSTKLEVQRMSNLISNLLFLSKNSDETTVELFSNIDFSDLVLNRVLSFESIAYEQDIDYKYYIQPDIYFKGDGEQLEMMVSILIDNAMKYCDLHAGVINIQLEEKKDIITFTVNNNGQIIAKEELKNLFDRFYRVDKSRSREQGGVGLGLSIAKEIATTHRGTITVTSNPTEYTTFKVTFRP